MKKLLIVLAVVLLFVGCSSNEAEDTPVLEEENNVVFFDNQNVESLIISKMSVGYYNGYSHISFELTNENNTVAEYNSLVVSYYTENDILLYDFEKYIGTIEANSVVMYEIPVDVDLTDASKVIYELK